MMIFKGNYSTTINCDELIDECKKNPGLVITEPKYVEDEGEESLRQYQLLKDAGYLENNTIKLKHFYPEKDFNIEYMYTLAKKFGVEYLHGFVNALDPGFCAPWHSDIPNSKYLELQKTNEVKKFILFLSKPKVGAGFLLENTAYYMEPQGNAYEFPHLNSMHGGFNIGYETKYVLVLTGFVP